MRRTAGASKENSETDAPPHSIAGLWGSGFKVPLIKEYTLAVALNHLRVPIRLEGIFP